MMIQSAVLSAVALCFSASLVLADEVLYCTDTAAIGFMWDDTGKARRADFNEKRYTVKVISRTQRVIADTDGSSKNYTCHNPEDRIVCDNDVLGGTPWVFYKNNYARAFLFGTPVGPSNSMDPNITIAYGTCAHF